MKLAVSVTVVKVWPPTSDTAQPIHHNVSARNRRRLASLIFLMGMVTLCSGGFAMYLLYATAFEEQQARLHDAVRNHARLIEAVARYDASRPGADRDLAAANTLYQVIDAHERSAGFGDTGELVLARREGEQIVFVLSQRHGHRAENRRRPAPLPFDGELATPMRQALTGNSGSFVGIDYRGERVLAAYEPVEVLNMGLVAKIDIDELQAPFMRAAFFGGLVGLLAIVLSALLFVRATSPLVKHVKQSAAYNRAIVESAPVAIIAVDPGDRIESFNPAAERIFQYSSDMALGVDIKELVPSFGDSLEIFLDSQVNRRRSNKPELWREAHEIGEIQGIRADGSSVLLQIAVSHLGELGRSTRIAIIRDISRHVRLERELRQAQKMKAIGTLASGIAHDFNNLLMGITGCADVALRKCERQDSVFGYLGDIKRAAMSGASITRQLLTFARRDHKAATEVCSLNDIVTGTAQMIRRLIGEDIAVTVTLSAEEGRIRCVRGEMEQILVNFVINARHAMPDGGTLTISTGVSVASNDRDPSLQEEEAAAQYALLTVSDTGCGMSDAVRARIFEPFFTTKEQGDGTGLGLSMAYGIVTQHGGRIDVDSAPDKGTTFRVYWPLTDEELTSVTTAHQPPPESESAPALQGHETILLVEDEELVRQSIYDYLTRSGYRVIEAGNAEDALEVCRHRIDEIDLVLTDIVLPRASGPELTRQVLDEKPDMPVIFMSAYPKEKLIEDGRILPENESLQKPFTETILLARVRQALAVADAADAADATDAADAADAMSVEPAGSQPDMPEVPAGRTILLVEDQDLARMACAELLDDLGYRVLAAANCREALSLCRQHSHGIDVVITDIGLPDGSGVEMMTQVKQLVTVGAVVYMSGRDRRDPKLQSALSEPSTEFMTKPIDFDQMATVLEELAS